MCSAITHLRRPFEAGASRAAQRLECFDVQDIVQGQTLQIFAVREVHLDDAMSGHRAKKRKLFAWDSKREESQVSLCVASDLSRLWVSMRGLVPIVLACHYDRQRKIISSVSEALFRLW